MARLSIENKEHANELMESLCSDMSRRLTVNPQGNCPLDLTRAFLGLSAAQSCGKCVPCREGLEQLQHVVLKIARGEGTEWDVGYAQRLAQSIYDSADCAIGFEGGRIALESIKGFQEEYLHHATNGACSSAFNSVPCQTFCPAHVDIPGYVALVGAKRYADAVRLIRNNNPFPSACAWVCEHPCENNCRRTLVDDAINIRGLKHAAITFAPDAPVPDSLPKTGKSVGIVGGGPGGLTAAYYLALMGHEVTIYERQEKLGGMLRYGIPAYRLSDEMLDNDINAIVSAGVNVKTNVDIGTDITLDELRNEHDSVYVAIGAHAFKTLHIDGEDKEGVITAVDFLRDVASGNPPDFKDKTVIIVGGGNVAMDSIRTARRLGVKSAEVVYRRRKADMTALPAEVEGAVAEACKTSMLMAPVRIIDGTEKRLALVAQPQIPGGYSGGRPRAEVADLPEVTFECDYIISAVGQDIETKHFEESGMPAEWGCFLQEDDSSVPGMEGLYVGGDCASGPSTVIRAIAAGRVAAANIDEYLGFDHNVTEEIDIPAARYGSKSQTGRVEMRERPGLDRAYDFEVIEEEMTEQEALQESSRCLRCDHYGYGALRGKRSFAW